MFLFSFLGAELSPYGYQELFYTTEERLQDFGGIQKNEDLRFLVKENVDYSSGARAYMLKALGEGKNSYKYGDKVYDIESLSDRVYLIHSASEVASIMQLGKKHMFVADEEVPAELEAAAMEAIERGQSEIDVAGQIYTIESSGREHKIYSTLPIALASYNVVNFDNPESKNSFDFQFAIEQAVLAGAGEYMVEVEGKNYEVKVDEEGQAEIRLDNTLYSTLSPHMVNALNQSLHLPIGFVAETLNAIENKSNSFTYTLNGEEREFVLEIRYERWVIREMSSVTVYNIRSAPSKEHWLGTDATGMDMFTA